ncbi:MAG: hypothetical protein COZ18_08375 [Flexibacter sp. CG_4_10_14_3_um_filter_32_15]|nr:MAG: hypothetical protein COZ18_08375 [Flexibacter sp. CG_4_10_14_3_um_filter_32_15]
MKTIPQNTVARIKILLSLVEFDEQEELSLIREASEHRTSSVKELTLSEAIRLQSSILSSEKWKAVFQMRLKVTALRGDLARIAPKYFQDNNEHFNNYLATNKRLFKNRISLKNYTHSELVKLISQLEAMSKNLARANRKQMKVSYNSQNK